MLSSIIAVITSLAIILVSIFLHELGHIIFLLLMRVPFKGIHLGLPIPPKITIKIGKRQINFSPWLQKKITIRKLNFFVQPWLFGGGVDVDEESFQNLPYTKKALFALMGPVATLTLCLGLTYLYLGSQLGNQITSDLVGATSRGVANLASGNSPVGMGDLVGPIGLIILMAEYIQMDFRAGVVLSMIILNYVIFIANMLPIPALDGGYIFWGPLWKINKSFETAGKKLNAAFFYFFLILVLILTVKDIYTLILK